MNHKHYMQQAIALGKHNPDHPYGAVIVDEAGTVVASGYNQSSKGAIYHGEIVALEALFNTHEKTEIKEKTLTIYSTAEPCPMCSSAILWSSIKRIVYGTSIQTLKSQGRPQIDISCAQVVDKFKNHDAEIVAGVCEKECDAMFLGSDINF